MNEGLRAKETLLPGSWLPIHTKSPELQQPAQEAVKLPVHLDSDLSSILQPAARLLWCSQNHVSK